MERKKGLNPVSDRTSTQGSADAIPGDTLAEIALRSVRMLPDAIVVADMRERDTPLVWVSEQFTSITGYSQTEALGKNCRYLQGNDHLQPEIEQLRDALRRGEGAVVTMRNYRKDGTLFWNELTLSPHLGPDGRIDYYVGLIRNVTEMKENLNQVIRDARNDRLTGLPNRDSFLEDIESIQLSEGCRRLVVKLDLAGLHNINSTYGYTAGDEILRKMAPRLRSLEPDALGRIGNNEFAVAFHLLPSLSEETVLAKIATVMRPPFAIPDAIMVARYALGYTLGCPGQAATLLTQQAGYALHESKADPARAPRRFDETAERVSRLRSRLTTELQQAVRDGDFIYHYQPQFDMQTNEIVGVEALIRWNHPVFGLQWPDTFIGIAEETGLIIDIERAGIRQVANFALAINKGRSKPLIFAVNISALEVTRGNLEGLLTDIIRDTGIDPSWLTLELTESLLTEGSQDVVEQFRRLRGLGVGLAIDDFGTGYSSLRSIERFPISEIKVDRSFTQNMMGSGTKRIVTETIVSLGQELAVKVVAEGIETEEHYGTLKEMGCLIGQGYLFSRPLPADQFLAFLAVSRAHRDSGS
jgi:PAS domain S-box-containing protein/diguanylate cyclase (GGDEF)-like protein